MTGDTLVRHDWTYRELQRVARMAARRVSSAQWNFDERIDVAFVAIVEHLWMSPQSPDERDLANTGAGAVQKMWHGELNANGWTWEQHLAPKYHMYWAEWHAPREPATDRIDERIALAQVCAALTDAQLDVVWTRAMLDDLNIAAAAYGTSREYFLILIRRARDRARALWFDGETPTRTPIDRRCTTTNPENRRKSAHDRIAKWRYGDRKVAT